MTDSGRHQLAPFEDDAVEIYNRCIQSYMAPEIRRHQEPEIIQLIANELLRAYNLGLDAYRKSNPQFYDAARPLVL